MRVRTFGIFLLLLFGFLFLGLIGDLFDEEQRQLFDLWLIALLMLGALVGAWLIYFRQSGRPRAADSGSAKRVEEVERRPTNPPIAFVTLGALFGLSALWVVLVHFGDTPDGRDEAFDNLQMITAVITSIAAVLLSVWAPTAHRSTLLKLRLAAIGLLALAAVGIFAVPLIAVRYWFGYVDFEKYVPEVAGAWIYVTIAGVLLCLLRTRRGKKGPP